MTSAYAADYLETAVLNHAFRGIAMPAPAAHFMALFRGDPAAGGLEVDGKGYARRAIAFSPANRDAEGALGVDNAERVEFARAEGPWGRVTHYTICDARTDGNHLTPGVLRKVHDIQADDVLEIGKGELRVKYERRGVA